MWTTPVWSPGGGEDWLGVSAPDRGPEEEAAAVGEELAEREEEGEGVTEEELEAPMCTFAPLTVVVNVCANAEGVGAGAVPSVEAAGEAARPSVPLGPIATTSIDVTISTATSTTIAWSGPRTIIFCVMTTAKLVGDAARRQTPSSIWRV